jgi:hypothetical protein
MNYENVGSSAPAPRQGTTTRVLICAAVVFLIVLGLALVANGRVSGGEAIAALRNVVIPSVITALWLRSPREAVGSWGKVAVAFVVVYVAYTIFVLGAEKLIRLAGGAG